MQPTTKSHSPTVPSLLNISLAAFRRITVVAFNSHIRLSLTEERVQMGFAKLRDISPQAAAYFDDVPLALWAATYLLGRRYGPSTSNLVEVVSKWVLEERRPPVLDLLHTLWSKFMDIRFRGLQEARKHQNSGAILTKYPSNLLQESIEHSTCSLRGC